MWKTLWRGLDDVEMVHNTVKDMLNLDKNNRYRKGVKICGNFQKFCMANVYFGMDRIMKQQTALYDFLLKYQVTRHFTEAYIQAKTKKYPSIEWSLIFMFSLTDNRTSYF